MDSYMRRTMWLQRNQAIHVVNVYAEAMAGDKKKRKSSATATTSKRKSATSSQSQKVSGDDFLNMISKRTA